MAPTRETDIAIIGGGIVGLATAYQLTEQYPNRHVTILEKEPGLARHQSGRNSGVLHSGIYYQPGSLKARNCRTGKEAMVRFCKEHGLDFDLCGKVIVAADDSQISTLNTIYERGRANGVACRRIDRSELRDIEPHATGVAAIHVPESGIVNYAQVCEKLAELVRSRDNTIETNTEVRGLSDGREHVLLETSRGRLTASYAVNCAGLYSDRIVSLSGQKPDVRIVPFRGEYYKLAPEAHSLCRGLIYPVPDPAFPFLGVHFTPTVEGDIECGPNAVLAFAREGYDMTTINWSELMATLTYPGFQKLAYRYWRAGLAEMWRSVSKSSFAADLQRLVPAVEEEHLMPAPSGVRAQAVTRDGKLLDDFLVQETERTVHVCNAPSPAATASLNIGTYVVDILSNRFKD